MNELPETQEAVAKLKDAMESPTADAVLKAEVKRLRHELSSQTTALAPVNETLQTLYIDLANGKKDAFRNYKWTPAELEKLDELVDIYTDKEKLLAAPTQQMQAISLGIEVPLLRRWLKTTMFAELIAEAMQAQALIGVAKALPSQVAFADSTLKGSSKAFETLSKIAGIHKTTTKFEGELEVKVSGVEGLLTKMKRARPITVDVVPEQPKLGE